MSKILIVDDDASICSMVSMALAAENRELAEAVNGKEAQKMLETSAFDLVISDVVMPDCDGIELMMDIRRKRPDVPVIIISGGGRIQASDYLNLAEKLGAAYVFEKPFKTSDLRDAVAELLGETDAQTINI